MSVREIQEKWADMERRHAEELKGTRRRIRWYTAAIALITPVLVFAAVYLARLAWELAGGAL